MLKLQLSPTVTCDSAVFAARAPDSQSAHVFPDRYVYASQCSIASWSLERDFGPTAHASDHDNPSVPDNFASVHLLSTVRNKPRVPIKFITAAYRPRSPVSSDWSQESDIVVAARSFPNFLGDQSLVQNSLRSRSLFCGVIKRRARRSMLYTESQAPCVHSNSHASRANFTADDRHSLLYRVHPSPLKALPSKHVRNPLCELDSNSWPRDSVRMQTFSSCAPTSCTDERVTVSYLKFDCVTRLATLRYSCTIGSCSIFARCTLLECVCRCRCALGVCLCSDRHFVAARSMPPSVLITRSWSRDLCIMYRYLFVVRLFFVNLLVLVSCFVVRFDSNLV